MPTDARPEPAPARRKRSDALRNQEALLSAAAAVFITDGVDAPIRRIAAEAGVGVGTIYRHFPARSDLIAAVYRHQVEECAEAGPKLLAANDTPFEALSDWIDMFVDFLVTKHGLAKAMRSEDDGFQALHGYFLDRLVPVCERLLAAAAEAGEIATDLSGIELMRGVGDLCVGRDNDPDYDPRRLIDLLLNGLRSSAAR